MLSLVPLMNIYKLHEWHEVPKITGSPFFFKGRKLLLHHSTGVRWGQVEKRKGILYWWIPWDAAHQTLLVICDSQSLLLELWDLRISCDQLHLPARLAFTPNRRPYMDSSEGCEGVDLGPGLTCPLVLFHYPCWNKTQLPITLHLHGHNEMWEQRHHLDLFIFLPQAAKLCGPAAC